MPSGVPQEKIKHNRSVWMQSRGRRDEYNLSQTN